MTIKEAKQLREGSVFWTPSRNGHDKSGFRLQIVIGASESGLICFDEHGYRAVWLWSDCKAWLGVVLIQPAGATDFEPILDHLRRIGQLHK